MHTHTHTMKTHEFVVRFTTTTQLVAHLQKTLRATIAIELTQFTVVNPTGSATWMIKLAGSNVPATNSWMTRGYPIPVGKVTNTVVFDNPRLVSLHAVPTLTSLDISITDFDGSAVTFDELTLWFLVRYNDDTTDLAVRALESGLTEPVTGANNWRDAPPNGYATSVFSAMARHVFSDISNKQ